MVCAHMAHIAMAFTVMACLETVMATHIVPRVIRTGVVPKMFAHAFSILPTLQFSSVHNTLCGRARVHTHSYMRTVGLYIQAQLPESFGNLSALTQLDLERCTGLVHTCHTTCTHAHTYACTLRITYSGTTCVPKTEGSGGL